MDRDTQSRAIPAWSQETDDDQEFLEKMLSIPPKRDWLPPPGRAPESAMRSTLKASAKAKRKPISIKMPTAARKANGSSGAKTVSNDLLQWMMENAKKRQDSKTAEVEVEVVEGTDETEDEEEKRADETVDEEEKQADDTEDEEETPEKEAETVAKGVSFDSLFLYRNAVTGLLGGVRNMK